MLIVVAYDVADDRRRTRLRTLLLGYGEPVQESVVECELSEAQHRALRRQVAQTIDAKVDRVAYYPLCAGCAAKAEDQGGRRRPRPAVVVV